MPSAQHSTVPIRAIGCNIRCPVRKERGASHTPPSLVPWPSRMHKPPFMGRRRLVLGERGTEAALALAVLVRIAKVRATAASFDNLVPLRTVCVFSSCANSPLGGHSSFCLSEFFVLEVCWLLDGHHHSCGAIPPHASFSYALKPLDFMRAGGC